MYVYTNKHTRNWIATVLQQNVLHTSSNTNNDSNNNNVNADADESMNGTSYNSNSGGGAAGSTGNGNLLSKGNGVLKQTNTRILLNERALLAAKVEEAEYNRYMKEKRRVEQREKEEEEERQRAEQQQHLDSISNSNNRTTSSTSNISNSPSTDRVISNDDSVRSERYHSQVMAASPIGRFISPLWSQYDSDEEDEVIRKSLMPEDMEAQANMQSNKQLSDRNSTTVVAINNPMLTTSNVHENTLRNSFTKSNIIQLFRKPTSTSTTRPSEEDESGKPSSYKSSGSDMSAGRGSDKFVRFGNHQTRLISRNSEHDNRTSSMEDDIL